MGFVTKAYLETQFTNFATRIATVFAKKTEIPAKTSDLTNDSGYITSEADNLTNYYKKSQTYTKDEVAGLIAGGGVSALVFDTKADLDTWIASAGNTATLKAGQNIYIKEMDVPDYWWDGSALQPLETQKVDLTGYVTEESLATKLSGYLKTTDTETSNIDFSTYFA